MNRCPITYEACEEKYSPSGLSRLSPRLKHLADLPFTAREQRQEAASRAGKMSIQGIQPKLSARLSIRDEAFEIVDSMGTYIIKPQSDIFSEVPENEDLTMKMAGLFGIDVPLTGLIYSKDGSLSYFIKRFDRYGRNRRKQIEDFAQLTQNTRETKYNWSVEKLVPVIETHCTFPLIEKRKLFRRILFCFLTGNEDMHLKNFSLMIHENRIELSPAYDLLNTTIAMDKAVEELALPLAGKKSHIRREHLLDYFGRERLSLTEKTISAEIQNIEETLPALRDLIEQAFLSDEMKDRYRDLMKERCERVLDLSAKT